MNKRGSQKGQVALFVILALLLIGGTGIYFLLRGSFLSKDIPARFQPIYQYFVDCSKESAEIGIALLEKQAGFIDLPEFFPGSEFSPSSSQLDFFGAPVPYWYYLSGNNIIKEQVPTKIIMEEQLEKFIDDDLRRCSLSAFADQGFLIDRGEASTDVTIHEESVEILVRNKISASFGEEKVLLEKFPLNLESKLGKFYDIALKIYQYEKEHAFLENYAVDALRLYAPVDGVEISCAPKIWNVQDVAQDIQEALEANTQALKVQGDYYKLQNERRKYFVVPFQSDEQVNFIYSRFWPTKIEVNPVENGILLGEPVGQGAGLGILGFCYIPYHFVYDLHYPVLIQILDGNEIFQFPLVVIIDKNKPRLGLDTIAAPDIELPLCNQKVQDIEIYTYNTLLEPVTADIDFKCLNQKCDIGKTQVRGVDSILREKVPQCVNGYFIANAPGYSEERYQISTNTETTANIVLDKLYTLTLDLKVDGKITQDLSLIYFRGEEDFTLAYPDQKNLQISEGSYNITVYVYRNSTIALGGYSETKCVKVPKRGVFGFFGGEDEECFQVEIPAQTISNVIAGGGKAEYFFVESELQQGKTLEINVESLPVPTQVEEIPDNYEILEVKSMDILVK